MTACKNLIALAALAAMGLASAQAATVYSDNFSALGELAAPGSVSTSFASATAGTATLSFELAGYRSLDGANNCCSDYFMVELNGNLAFWGSFNLGGGGDNLVFFAPAGASVLTTTFGASDDAHHSNQITWAGGTVQVTMDIALASGTNALVFTAGSVGQGFKDEAWGLNQVNVTTAVPEPETTALMLAGLGVLGFLSRRRRDAFRA